MQNPALVAAWAALVAAVGTVLTLTLALVQIATERRRREASEAEERTERHLAQARLISAFRGELYGGKVPDLGRNETTDIYLRNGSQEPVYKLVVGLVFIQGAAPHTLEKLLEFQRDRSQPPMSPSVPVTTVSILPGGTYRVRVALEPGVLGGRYGAEVMFTDRNGSSWVRRPTGELQELPSDAFEYLQQFGLHGPYELQAPEPFSSSP